MNRNPQNVSALCTFTQTPRNESNLLHYVWHVVIDLCYLLWPVIILPQTNEIRGVQWSQQTVGRAVGEMLFLKLLPQFSSYLNENCLHMIPMTCRCT